MDDRAGVAKPRRRRSSAEEPSDSRQIRELASALGLRITFDDDVLPVIPGRYGQIESFDRGTLAVYTRHPRLFRRLWAIRGVQPHQTGDTEMRAVFPAEALEQVAYVIKARHRRTLSPEEARRRGFKPTHRATSEP